MQAGPGICLSPLFIYFLFFFNVMNICLHVSMCILCLSSAHRGQKGVLDPLELYLLETAIWMPGTEYQSYVRTASTQPISPVQPWTYRNTSCGKSS